MKNSIRKKDNPAPRLLLRWALITVFTLAVLPVMADRHDKVKEESKELNPITARDVFVKLQSSSLEILPSSVRLDMLDYWDVDSVYRASNVMGGLSWLEAVTPSYLKVRVTPVSYLEIKILPDKKEEIIMSVYTVGDDPQAADSQLSFYDRNLNLMETKDYFKIPELKDFFAIPKGSATTIKEIEQMIPFPTIAYSATADSDNITARLTVEQYINQDDWNIAKLFIKPYITLEWKKGKYHLMKK